MKVQHLHAPRLRAYTAQHAANVKHHAYMRAARLKALINGSIGARSKTVKLTPELAHYVGLARRYASNPFKFPPPPKELPPMEYVTLENTPLYGVSPHAQITALCRSTSGYGRETS